MAKYILSHECADDEVELDDAKLIAEAEKFISENYGGIEETKIDYKIYAVDIHNIKELVHTGSFYG